MAFSSYDILEPSDIKLLRSVLEDACQELGLSITDPAAEEMARDLLQWHLIGVHQPDQLKTMLAPVVSANQAKT